jgi:uncharacterized protein
MRTATIVFACLLSFAALAHAEEQPRTISTSGDALVKVTPDEVIVNVGVETYNANLDEAKSANDINSTKLVNSIKALGIEEKYIQTDNMVVELDYKNDHRVVIEGYVTRRAYSIVLKDTKLFAKLVDVALKNGANRMAGFEFRTTELRKHRDEARKMAIKAAKEKAEMLAKELNCTVGAPRTINEYGVGYAFGGSNWNAQSNAQVAIAAPVVGEGGESLPLGQMGVNAQVSVTFDLIPNPSLGGK